MQKICIVIPARYKSTRLEGKPLKNIQGKKMIQMVWEQCTKSLDKNKIFIATDDSRIEEFCKNNNMNTAMTSKNCLTGTDRVYDFSKKNKFDIYINIQGDEPLIDPKDIKKIINLSFKYPDSILNGMTKITNETEYKSKNIPKVVTDKNNNLLYMSRAPIPSSKFNKMNKSYKQVCIYSFPRKYLQIFGKLKYKSKNEKIEDIEILRFLDNSIKVKMVEFSNTSIAVDTYTDLKKVRKIVENKNL